MATRDLDRTPEDVAKEQHEHHRLDGDEHDQFRHTHGFKDAPPGEHQRVEDGPDKWPPAGDRPVAGSRRQGGAGVGHQRGLRPHRPAAGSAAFSRSA